ncbi:hypothetical protein CSC2_36210 [Clostridium zeae]|uniref:VanZ-like domain-containing protein n=2 Tax=Clostridium zeae TaxID=2759022 RepID=A0ABQ1EE89_9CLOT|nr:hypothetical protein CSC2_36210 [Clostridium zeae]
MMHLGNKDIILRNILGNIILLRPLGFFTSLLFKKFRKFGYTLLIGFIFSVGIEGMQFLISAILGFTYKITDVDDIILNIYGAVVGFIMFKLFSILIESDGITEN